MKPQPCPTCKQPATWEGNLWRPFCSERCKLIDLGQWAMEKYRVPGEQGKSEPEQQEEEKKEPEDID